MKKIILSIEGMTCSACSSGLEKYLKKQEGIEEASVNLVLATAAVQYNENIITVYDIEEYIKEAGFKSLGEFKDIRKNQSSSKEIILFTLYTILLFMLMYICMKNMIHQTEKHTIELCGITILFLLYGFDLLKNGFKNLIHKTPNMDTLVGIGVVTTFLYSLYHMIEKQGSIYFESAAFIIYFVKLGKMIDRKSKDKTKEAISKLASITPNHARIKENDGERTVTLDEIKKGDIIICSPGEKIAVDGIIIKGKAHVDESFITGESKPKEKGVNDTVVAGSMNYDGYIEYTAERIGKESTVSEIVQLVLEATNSKTKVARIADTISSFFVPIVMIIALLSLIINWLISKDFNAALTSFVTVLVVSCPCALGLATPLALVVSEGLCIENGILVKKNEILEKARKTDTIVFDKTGTLTYGKLKVSKIYNYTRLTDKVLMQIVGSLEYSSSHPIATAFRDYLKEKNIDTLEVKDFKEVTGLGLTGIVEGKQYYVGNRNLIKKQKIKNNYKEDGDRLSEKGNSIIYIANSKEVLGLIGVNDIIRKDTIKVIKELKENNIETIMLTGDNQKTADTIANKLGIDQIIAGVLPKDKKQMIEELKENHKMVMMCGDGINDSPSLAIADIGVSVSDGTDIAMDAADVVLTKNDLNSILDLIKISKRTIRSIKQNLFWAFFYNILMIPIAVGLIKPFGITINPMVASIAMVCSSLTVILNTLRLKRLKRI